MALFQKTTSPLSFKRCLSLGLILLMVPIKAGFAGGIADLAKNGGVMGIMSAITFGKDAVKDGRECANYQYVSCALAVVDVGGAVMGVAISMSNSAAKDPTDGTGGGSLPNFDPNKTIAENLGDPNVCADPAAAATLVCNNAVLKKTQADLQLTKDLLLSGKMDPQNGQSLDQALAAIDSAQGGLSDISSGKIPKMDKLSGTGFSGGEDIDYKKGVGEGAGAYGDAGAGGGSGSYGDGSKILAGPANRAGLGATLWNGNLDMLDDATGRSLTMWQRATRRYQGLDGKRAFLLARVEGIRKNQFLTTTKALKNPDPKQILADAAKRGIKPPKLAEASPPHKESKATASRKPASVIGKAP